MSAPRALSGLGVSVGFGLGPAVRVRPVPGVDPSEPAAVDAAADGARVREALAAVATRLEARAERADGEGREILLMTAKLATDRGLAKSVDKQLAAGAGMTRAVHDAMEGYVGKLQQLGGYMAQRATDLYDVRDRAISELRGLPEPGVPEMTGPGVVVAHDLAPAETAVLDPSLVLGIVTEVGGPTSHTAILASGLGIPAVVRVAGAGDIAEGEVVALDGGTGEVVVAPSEEQRDAFRLRAERRRAALAGSWGPGRTADGHAVPLLANVGTLADALRAAEQDVEGVGLFRTEFLFLDRQEPPSLDEQTATYTEALRAFGDRRVVIRTLDAGADKPLPFADLGAEENPALGRRGLRLSRAREDLLDTQLAALAAAQSATGADLRVMAPMVATVEEARWFAGRVRAHGLASVGIMIETPASAVRSAHLLDGLDFASIGTNDLTQYTMAADRMQGELADLLSPWQPAVLDMVQMACEGGSTTGAGVGVCGEAAGDPLLALVLVGLGVSSLSMSPNKVAAVRVALGLHPVERCRELAGLALGARTAPEARDLVAGAADPIARELAQA
ncbi:phosphoenolpyruvate--protein phosphotransferase [Tessaracoccus oleiagri]|uniref:Phosphoenolpyruvate-protein phosphotransferase n=1 Tax=Tessaracoccus oleiagri TaxID=686624 RepID=A0A1G9HYJ6_9ACTN|nr:phosphoenolpyruvate--protein phosphotransferase [Tessaracoccus oleiagri]SDL17895.1 phosphotransferase system, enzyme I, PtsI [Tessaracoccus oleiagri]